ncbi:hypothetical protein Ancab_022222 [Ancistrocladus abbreviatus]
MPVDLQNAFCSFSDAYYSISAFSARRDNQEAVFGAEGLNEIRDATLAYKAEALQLQRQLSQLQAQFDMLAGQASALVEGRRARVTATSVVTGQINTMDDSLSARNLEMNAGLGRIASTAQELAHYHSLDGVKSNPWCIACRYVTLKAVPWLAWPIGVSINATVLTSMQDPKWRLQCRAMIKHFRSAKKADIADNPYILYVASSRETVWMQVIRVDHETVRFGTSERQWVEAQVENAKQQAILMALKSQVASDEAHIHMALHSLRRKHTELVGELSNLHHKEEKLLSEVCMILVAIFK